MYHYCTGSTLLYAIVSLVSLFNDDNTFFSLDIRSKNRNIKNDIASCTNFCKKKEEDDGIVQVKLAIGVRQ